MNKDILKVISILYNLGDEELTSYQLVKKAFSNESEYELKKKEMTMKYQLLKLSGEGVVEININKNTRNYNLIKDKCVIKKFDFPWGKRKGIALKLKSGWTISEL